MHHLISWNIAKCWTLSKAPKALHLRLHSKTHSRKSMNHRFTSFKTTTVSFDICKFVYVSCVQKSWPIEYNRRSIENITFKTHDRMPGYVNLREHYEHKTILFSMRGWSVRMMQMLTFVIVTSFHINRHILNEWSMFLPTHVLVIPRDVSSRFKPTAVEFYCISRI